MLFHVMIKKSAFRVLPFGALLVLLLNLISLIDDLFFRIIGISAAVIGFTIIFSTIEYFMYRKLNRNITERKDVRIEEINEAYEINAIEELAPIEEENDFGELLEVEEQLQQPVLITKPPKEIKQEPIDFFSAANQQENVEELEVLDESVEELEAIDE